VSAPVPEQALELFNQELLNRQKLVWQNCGQR